MTEPEKTVRAFLSRWDEFAKEEIWRFQLLINIGRERPEERCKTRLANAHERRVLIAQLVSTFGPNTDWAFLKSVLTLGVMQGRAFAFPFLSDSETKRLKPKRLGGRRRSEFYTVKHEAVRDEFRRLRKKHKDRTKKAILQEMEAMTGSLKMRQLQTICAKLK